MNFSENNIVALLQKVRDHHEEIGTYQGFEVTKDMDYKVNLSNGTVLIKSRELEESVRDGATLDLLTTIAHRFAPLAEIADEETLDPEPLPESVVERGKNAVYQNILIIVFGLAIVIGGLVLLKYINDPTTEEDKEEETYSEKVRTVAEVEQAQPAVFLSADCSFRRNLLGKKFRVKCNVTNKATVATYKDAVIRITSFSSTKSVLDRKKYTLYDVFPPNSTKTIDLKIDRHNEADSLSCTIIHASVDY